MIAGLSRRIGGNSPLEIALAVAVGLGLAFVVLVLSNYNLPIKMVVLVIGFLGSILVVLTFGDVKRLLLMAIYLDISTALDFHVTCNETYFLTTCGFNISVTAIALAGLCALWLIDLRRARREGLPKVKRGLPVTLSIAFVAATMLSLIRAPLLLYGFYQIWVFAVAALLLIYVVSHIEGEKDVLFFLYCMAAGLAIQVVIMEFQGLGLVDNTGASTALGQRITGTLHSPNVAGAYLAQVISILLPFMFLKVERWQKWIVGGLLLVAIHSLVATQSRGGWSSLAIGFLIILIVGMWKKWINIKSLVVILLVMSVAAAIFSDSIIRRLTADDNGAADARAPLAEIAWNMVRLNPVVGVGTNNFGIVLFDYVEPDQYGAWLNIVHNEWLLVWSETGTLGFIIYVSLWLATAWQAFKLIRKGHPVYSCIALGILASMAGASVNMLTQSFAGRAQIQLVWVEVAMITAMVWLQHHDAQIRDLLPARRYPPLNRIEMDV